MDFTKLIFAKEKDIRYIILEYLVPHGMFNLSQIITDKNIDLSDTDRLLNKLTYLVEEEFMICKLKLQQVKTSLELSFFISEKFADFINSNNDMQKKSTKKIDWTPSSIENLKKKVDLHNKDIIALVLADNISSEGQDKDEIIKCLRDYLSARPFVDLFNNFNNTKEIAEMFYVKFDMDYLIQLVKIRVHELKLEKKRNETIENVNSYFDDKGHAVIYDLLNNLKKNNNLGKTEIFNVLNQLKDEYLIYLPEIKKSLIADYESYTAEFSLGKIIITKGNNTIPTKKFFEDQKILFNLIKQLIFPKISIKVGVDIYNMSDEQAKKVIIVKKDLVAETMIRLVKEYKNIGDEKFYHIIAFSKMLSMWKGHLQQSNKEIMDHENFAKNKNLNSIFLGFEDIIELTAGLKKLQSYIEATMTLRIEEEIMKIFKDEKNKGLLAFIIYVFLYQKYETQLAKSIQQTQSAVIESKSRLSSHEKQISSVDKLVDLIYKGAMKLNPLELAQLKNNMEAHPDVLLRLISGNAKRLLKDTLDNESKNEELIDKVKIKLMEINY